MHKETAQKHKVLITTLTKRMAEDLTAYMQDVGIRVKYLHSDIDTLERAEIIRDCRHKQQLVDFGFEFFKVQRAVVFRRRQADSGIPLCRAAGKNQSGMCGN